MVTTVTIIACVLGGAIVLLLGGGLTAIVKTKKRGNAMLKAVIKNTKHLGGNEAAAKLAKDMGKIGLVKAHSKKVKKNAKTADATNQLLNDLN